LERQRLQRSERALGSLVSLARQLLDAVAVDGDDPELGRDEESV
jgi:hypothetical protein